MYDLLSEYVDRCNKGEHFGMEIRELPEEPRQPAKVNFLNNFCNNRKKVLIQ